MDVKIFLAYSIKLNSDGNFNIVSALEKEINILNSEYRKYKFILSHFEISAPLGMNPLGPQGQIDPIIQNSEIVIFAFGKTIGNGILHEVKVALDRPEENRKNTWFFFPEQLPSPQNIIEAENAVTFHKLQDELWMKGLLGKYTNVDNLISKACSNLRKYITSPTQVIHHSPCKVVHQTEKNIFVGREDQLSRVKSFLTTKFHNYFAIQGIGGIGKTTLVKRAIDMSIAEGHVKHSVWIDLITPYNDITNLLNFCYNQFANSLNFDIFVKDSVQAMTNNFLVHINRIKNPTIVIFDNLEKIKNKDNFLSKIRELVKSLPSNFKFIFISQQDLSLFDLCEPKSIDPLDRQESKLLIEQKLAISGNHNLNESQVNQICAKSSGIPLLIEWMVEIVLLSRDGDKALSSFGTNLPETFVKSISQMLTGLDHTARKVWDYIWVASKNQYHLRSGAIKVLCQNESVQDILFRLESFPLITSRRNYITTIEALSIVYDMLSPSISEELIQENIAAYYLGVVSTNLKLRIESYEKTEIFHENLKDKDNFIRAFEYYLNKAERFKGELGYKYRIFLYQFSTNISWFLWINGFVNERINYLTKVIEIAIKHEEEPEKCLFNINDVAWTYYHLAKIHDANRILKYVDHPMIQIVQKSNIRYKAMINRLKANIIIKERIQDIKKGVNTKKQVGQSPVDLLNESLEIFKDIGEDRRIASVHSELGYYHFSFENYDAALESYTKSRDLALQINEKHSLPIYYWRVGETFLALYKKHKKRKYLNEAIKQLEKGLETSKDFRKQIEAHIRTRLAEALSFTNNNRGNISEHLKAAEDILREINDKNGLKALFKMKESLNV